jgi:hypothetical protein
MGVILKEASHSQRHTRPGSVSGVNCGGHLRHAAATIHLDMGPRLRGDDVNTGENEPEGAPDAEAEAELRML